MELDHLGGRHFVERTYIHEIRAVLSAVADGDFYVAWFGEVDGFQSI